MTTNQDFYSPTMKNPFWKMYGLEQNTVLEVSAVDDDEGSNKAIIYSFAKNGKYIKFIVWNFIMSYMCK